MTDADRQTVRLTHTHTHTHTHRGREREREREFAADLTQNVRVRGYDLGSCRSLKKG